ncbi:MAG: hypothetical protein JJT78_08265 [Leptospira sp.]|nr:hypothetical protein [Leptospira sp.]
MSFYKKNHIQDLSAFLDWVESFQVGSGLNDNEEYAGNFFRGMLAEIWRASVLYPGLY